MLAYNASGCRPGECLVARGDYRANAGNNHASDSPGPNEFGIHAFLSKRRPRGINGVTYQRSTVRVAQISDGTSKTALVGEKALDPEHYDTGKLAADDQGLYTGHDRDNTGVTGKEGKPWRPIKDGMAKTESLMDFRFGSAHPGVCHMVLCDGSVQSYTYEVDPEVFFLLGGRDDGDFLR
jgi:hypothetical protein